jgi:hypothetical protein
LYIHNATAVKRVEVKTRDGVVSLTDRVELFYEDRIT